MSSKWNSFKEKVKDIEDIFRNIDDEQEFFTYHGEMLQLMHLLDEFAKDFNQGDVDG